MAREPLSRSWKTGVLVGAASFSLLGSIPVGMDMPPRAVEMTESAPYVAPGVPEAIRPAPQVANPWSFFHPAWEEGFGRGVASVWPGSPAPSLEDLAGLLSDPKNRLEPELKISVALRARVLFWTEVYALFDSHMRVLHDRDNLDLVYGYIDLKALLRSERPSLTLERKMRRVERATRAILKTKIRAALSTRLKERSSEQIKIVAWLTRHGVTSIAQWWDLEPDVRSQSGQSDMFRLALLRSRALMPRMEQVFREHGLPAGLAHIPFVESSFNRRAYSKVGARGIWQFTPCAAREFLGRRNRRHWSDPLLQTVGAAHMLKQYRGVFPDWGSTVTSYNSGVTRVRRLVKRYRVKTADELVSARTEGLGFAGQNYFAELLAANFIDNYRTEIFTPDLFETKTEQTSGMLCAISNARPR